MKKFSLLLIGLATAGLLLGPGPLAAEQKPNNWPNWRGPHSDGHLKAEPGTFPVEWGPEKNITWKTPLPGPGNSSPVIWNNRIFLTQAVDQGQTRSLLCFDRSNGKLLWQKDVAYPEEDPTHKTNFFDSASPVTDGKLVYAWHGNAGLFAYDLNGQEKWKRTDLGKYIHQWGANAASPILYKNSLILYAGPGTEANLFAFDKTSGKTIWKTELPEAASENFKQFKGSWATPLLISNNDERDELILPLPQRLTAFNPATGEELWRCEGLSDLCYTNALSGDDLIVAMSGYKGPAIGVRLPDSMTTGDITDSHRLWHVEPNQQRIGSGIIVGDHIFILNEPGVAQCIEARSGREIWKARLGAGSWSSANHVGDLLYFTDQTGTTYVVEPNTTKLHILETNRLPKGEHTNASLAFSNGQIIQRTDKFLRSIKAK
ncbi:MAG: PQQ-binding-like beta-propeller repeat protein [Verrucomicrobiota bacterium]